SFLRKGSTIALMAVRSQTTENRKIKLTWPVINETKKYRYIVISVRAAANPIAKCGVWNRSLTLAKPDGTVLSKAQDMTSRLRNTIPSHPQPMFPMNSPITITQSSNLLGSSNVTKAVGTVDAPPPAVKVHASRNDMPTRLSKTYVSPNQTSMDTISAITNP